MRKAQDKPEALAHDPVSLHDRVLTLSAQLPLTVVGHLGVGALLSWLLALTHGIDGLVWWLWVSGWSALCAARWGLWQRYQVQLQLAVADWQRWSWYWTVTLLGLMALGSIAWAQAYPATVGWQRHLLMGLVASLCVGTPGVGRRWQGSAVLAIWGVVTVTWWREWQLIHTVSSLDRTLAEAGFWADLSLGIGLLVAAVWLGEQHRRQFSQWLRSKEKVELLAAQLATETEAVQEARAQAQVAHRARAQCLSAASHDLRQPLHALALLTQSLAQRNRDPHCRSTVGAMAEAVQVMEGLFDQLLDLSCLDSGAIHARPRWFRMQEVYVRLQAHLNAVAFDKGLSLSWFGGHQRIWADPGLIERILRNLIANAVRYTDQGGVVVACRRRGTQWLLQVWDTGMGMRAEQLPRIFEEFYRIPVPAQVTTPAVATAPAGDVAISPPKTPTGAGLGLGLSIVQRLAQLMSATVSVRSLPGRGTTFSLWLSAEAPG